MINLVSFAMIPIQGTEVATRWDGLYNFLVGLSVFFFVLVIGAMIYFIVVHPYRKGVKTQYITGSHLLEAFWIGVPTLLLMMIFVWGYSIYRAMSQSPADAYEIRVIGKQWLWNFQYDNGKVTTGEVFVPMNRPVKLIMTSEDVLHSFFVPNFRVKQDVVPGMYTSIWFTATVPGKHQVYCTQYCGTAHSGMLATINVLDDEQWNAWLRNKKIEDLPMAGSDQVFNSSGTVQLSMVERGKSVYHRVGCVACHSVDGSPKVGPTHKGLYGSKVELADGRVVVADENYIRKHIENPQSDVVKGFNPVMPTFKGLLSEAEMNELLSYMKSLK